MIKIKNVHVNFRSFLSFPSIQAVLTFDFWELGFPFCHHHLTSHTLFFHESSLENGTQIDGSSIDKSFLFPVFDT